jgi:FkbM family methyltransferase
MASEGQPAVEIDRTRWRTAFLAGLLLLLLGGWMFPTSSFEWRAHLIRLKLRGLLPRAAWSGLLFLPQPEQRLRQAWDVSTRFVKEKARGEEPCPVLWETQAGDFWGRENDFSELGIVFDEQFILHIYEQGPVAIQSGDVVFDGGSHLGAFTRFALMRGAGLVVAFEPDPINIACYKRTFQQEMEAGRVVLVEAALWEAPGTLDFTTAHRSGSGTVHPAGESPPHHLVPATTIDETVARLRLDRLDFIKMDIEGSERHALRGGRESISRFAPRMAICVYHLPDDPVVIPEEVRAARPPYQMAISKGVAYFH